MATARLRGVTHRYGGASQPALRDVDLDVVPGLLLLGGPSGGGKSSLLRVLNGLVPHFHGGRVGGTAVVAGHDVWRTPTRVLARHVGFVFQDPEAQLLGGTVERELAFGLENLAVPVAEMRRRVEEALSACGIEHLRGRPVATLSGGERQRVAVAATVAMGVEVLALDEPTAQLDPAGATAVARLLGLRAAAGVAVVVAEHRLERIRPLATQVAVVACGRLISAAAAAGHLATPPVVSLRSHPGGTEAWALRGVAAGMAPRPACVEGVDLVGRGGEVVVLRGANGAGKTTLLRVLAGLQPPLAGTVRRAPGRVALLPQNPTAVLHLDTVRAEVELTLRRTGEGGPAEAAAMLRHLGLGHLAERHPRDLSSGERQRAALAAMLCGRPSLALLDEPTRGMDAVARGLLVDLVGRLAGAGAAVVLATHDEALAEAVADRVVEVVDGAVREVPRPPARPARCGGDVAAAPGTALAVVAGPAGGGAAP